MVEEDPRGISLGWRDGVTVSAQAEPFKLSVQQEVIPPGKTICEIAKRYYRPGFDLCIDLNGRDVTDDEFETYVLVPCDVITVRAMPMGGGGSKVLRSVLTVALLVVANAAGAALAGAILGTTAAGAAAAGTWSALNIGFSLLKAGVAFATTAVGMLAINALIPLPKQGGTNVGSTATITNAANPYGVVPRLYGTFRIYPYLGAQQFTVYQSDHTYLYALFDLGYGPLELSDLKFGETPIGDFTNIEFEIRYGYDDDPPLTIYTDSVSQLNLQIQLADSGDGATRRTGTNTDVIQFDLIAPGGLFFSSHDGTHHNSTTVHFSVQVVDINTGITVFSNGYDVTDNNQQQVAKTVEVGLGGSQYDVTITRTSNKLEEPPSNTLFVWSALRSIRQTNPVLVKGHCLVAIKVQADNQFNGQISDFNCVATALVRTWDGSSFTVEANNHPAWAYLDALTGTANHAPAGDDEVDLDRLLAWVAAYPDAEFNAYLDQPSTVLRTLSDIAAAGRASFSLRDSLYSVAIDAPQTVPVQMFTPHNIVSFKGTQQFLDEIQGCRVTFISDTAQYQNDERIIYRDGFDSGNADFNKFETFSVQGITDPDKAAKQGAYYLAQAVLRPATYQLEMEVEYIVAQKGDLVILNHDVPMFGLMSGRILSVGITGGFVTTLTLDEPVPMEADKNYSIRIRFNDFTMQTVAVDAIDGETAVVTLTTPLAVGLTKVVAGNLFTFGETGSEARECLVKAIQPKNNLLASVTLVDYSPDVYTADGGTFPPYDPGISLPPTPRPPRQPIISVVKCDESTALQSDGGNLVPRILVSWVLDQSGIDPVAFDVQYAASDDSYFTSMPQVPGTASSAYIAPIRVGEDYTVRIRSVSDKSRPSDWAQVTLTASGFTVVPADTTGNTATAGVLGATIDWDIPSARVASTRLYVGLDSNFAHSELKTTVQGSGPYDITNLVGGTQYYVWITHVDYSGNESFPVGPMTVLPENLSADELSKIIQKAVSPAASIRQSVAGALFLPWLDTFETAFAAVTLNAALLDDVKGLVRDAGIIRDPANAQVTIYAVDALSDEFGSYQTIVTGKFDAVNARIDLTVTTTQLNQAITTALNGLVPLYRWEFETDTQSWTAFHASISAVASILTYSCSGVGPYLQSPTISIDTASYTVMQMRVRRTAGTVWDATFLWGVSFEYSGVITEPSSPDDWNVVQVNLQDTPGWIGTVTQFRIALGDASTVYQIDWITIGSVTQESQDIADLQDRMTLAEGSILIQGGVINSKASVTSVTDLSLQLSLAQVQIDGNTGEINLKAAQVDLNATNKNISTVEETLSAQTGTIEFVLGYLNGGAPSSSPEQIAANDAAGLAALLFAMDDVKALVGYARDGLYRDLLGERALRISSVVELQAQLDNNYASIVQISSAYVAADTAEAFIRSSADAALVLANGVNAAAITTESLARATADESLSHQITDLSAYFGNGIDASHTVVAAIHTEELARADGDQANADDITTLNSTIGGAYDPMSTVASAISGLSTQVSTKSTIFVQGTTPTAHAIGDMWVDTSSGNTQKTWTGSTWAVRSDTNKITTFAQNSAPSATAIGDIWIDTTGGANTMSRWGGSSWIAVDNATINANSHSIQDLNDTLTGYSPSVTVASAIHTVDVNVSTVSDTIGGSYNPMSTVAADLASRATATDLNTLNTSVGLFSATGLFRVSVAATPSGAASSIALEVAASSGVGSNTAAIYLDAMTGGATRIRILATQFSLTDGTTNATAFLYNAGTLYLNCALQAGAISATNIIANNIIVTGHIQTGAVETTNIAAGAVTSFDALDTPNAAGIQSGAEVNAFGTNVRISVSYDSHTKVYVQFSGSFVRAGGTIPVCRFRIYRKNDNGGSDVVISESTVGGNNIPNFCPFITSAVDTNPSAGGFAGTVRYYATGFISSGTTSTAFYNDAGIVAVAGLR